MIAVSIYEITAMRFWFNNGNAPNDCFAIRRIKVDLLSSTGIPLEIATVYTSKALEQGRFVCTL